MKTWKSLFGFTLLVGILVLLLASCKPTTYDTFGDIYGVVTDMDTAEPIVNAIVVLSPGGTSLMTAENGRYEYQALEPQQYTITVQKNGYSTNRKSVTVVPGEKTEANISIRKND
ncbi:carboxypeptidase-like regulatory domain-containing protein [bacterium]|nr:carboxypeptidase-like regulatory domain-containing protein [bacterium]